MCVVTSGWQKEQNRLCGHSLTDLPGVLLNKPDNSVVVFRSLIAKPSWLQYLECFKAQFNGFNTLVVNPCRKYQRLRFEIIFALSDTMMQGVPLLVIIIHALQHTDYNQSVREWQSEESAFQLSETHTRTLCGYFCFGWLFGVTERQLCV